MVDARITSTMQDDFPLTITSILMHGSQVFGRSECVTWQGDGGRHTSYRQSYEWPELDERSAAAMCYTSGTTGDPRGVVYSHRSTYLHALATLQNACTGASEADRQLTIVPMFHVNAWGIPFAAFMSGTTMHMPGKYMTPSALADFIEAEHSTLASAVPTIWAGILQVGAQREINLSSLRMGTSGGAAIPRSLMEAFQKQYGVRIIQGWGMTETSPVGGLALPPADVDPGTVEEMDYRMKSGRLRRRGPLRPPAPGARGLSALRPQGPLLFTACRRASSG